MTTSNAASVEKFVKMTFPSAKDADDTESILSTIDIYI